MKKLLCPILLVGVLAFIPNLNAATCGNYDKESLTYIEENTDPIYLDLTCENGTPYTNEYWEMIDNHDKELEENSGAQSRYFTSELNVTPFKQDKNYYCGYAATKEVIHYLNGSSESQSYYANYMGNPESSAVVYKIANTLTALTPKSYSYKLGSNYNKSSFVSLIENSVANNKPVVLHAITTPLAMYRGNKLYHYLVATGYTISGDENWNRRIIYVDSWDRDYGSGTVYGKHVDLSQSVLDTVNPSGRYVIY